MPGHCPASLFAYAYKIGVQKLANGVSAKAFVRQQLDRLELGAELAEFRWGSKQIRLPSSSFCSRSDTDAAGEDAPALATAPA